MWGGKTVVYFCKWSFFPRNYQKTYQIVSDFSKLCLIPLVEETVSGINATLLNRFTTSGKGFLLGLMWYLWWRAFTRWFQQDTFCINRTHRAADDVVLVRVPTDISHARVVAHQSGYHRAGQHIVDWTHTHTHRVQLIFDSSNITLCISSRRLCCRLHTDRHTQSLTDDFARGTAGVDESLPSAELWWETAAYQGVEDAMTSVGHHWGVACQLVSLKGCEEQVNKHKTAK